MIQVNRVRGQAACRARRAARAWQVSPIAERRKMHTEFKRIATATGVMLADPSILGNALIQVEEPLFDPGFWAARNEKQAVTAGRGAAWFVGPATAPWVLRHYRRGGAIAAVSKDRYLWLGEDRVRAFAEWRLLQVLQRLGLPVPAPVAAWYRRSLLTYRCDLLTARIDDAASLSTALAAAALPAARWRAIGAMLGRFHRAGVDHADLNAHNILLTPQNVYLIDFDRGRLRADRGFAAANLARLQRSLAKISAALPGGRYSDGDWNALLAGYTPVAAG
jgi:3-deoxy-D-manno-octulosonic acid kinase